jgi:hypothetical protein
MSQGRTGRTNCSSGGCPPQGSTLVLHVTGLNYLCKDWCLEILKVTRLMKELANILELLIYHSQFCVFCDQSPHSALFRCRILDFFWTQKSIFFWRFDPKYAFVLENFKI